MKLSIFTTITNPDERGDNWHDAINCYKELADEVVVVDGGGRENNSVDYRYLYREWKKDFSWEFIGEQFTRGYEACTGDVVIHADLDFIFHENDFDAIRKAAQEMLDGGHPAMSFYKYQFILPDRYNLKSRLVIMVNKRDYGNRIKFNSGGDLCQPSLDGMELKPNDVPESKVAFYNYEKLTKTEPQIKDDVDRMDRAHKRHFGKNLYSNDKRSAYQGWLGMVCGRFTKPQKHIGIEEHPIFIQDTIKNLRPDQFGFNAFGNLTESDYVKSSLRSR